MQFFLTKAFTALAFHIVFISVRNKKRGETCLTKVMKPRINSCKAFIFECHCGMSRISRMVLGMCRALWAGSMPDWADFTWIPHNSRQTVEGMQSCLEKPGIWPRC